MRKLIIAVVALFASIGAKAQIEAPVKWSYAAKKTSPTEATVYFKATIDKGWHIYSQTVADGGPIKTSFTFDKGKDFSPVGKSVEPKPISKYESAFKMNVAYFENTVIFSQKVKLKSPKTAAVTGKLEYMVCNNLKCLPPDEVEFNVPLGK